MTPAALLVAAALRLAPCQLPGVPEPLRCGTLDVAENRAAPAGRRIGLRVVVVPAKEATPGAAPLFHLEGGPGVAATGVAALYAVELPEYRRRREVVLVDLHHAPDGQRALELMFADCAADAACGRAFPRLREEMSEVLTRLARAPARTSPSASSRWPAWTTSCSASSRTLSGRTSTPDA